MKAAGAAFSAGERVAEAHKLVRIAQKPFAHEGVIQSLPGMLGRWTNTRDLPTIPAESFRDWWARRGVPR